MFSAGESSGDQHAANMFLAMKKQQPTLNAFGMGGRKMAQAGIDIRFDSSNIAVIGLVEVLKHYGEIRGALKQMQQLVKQEKPDLLICVDYKEFNFKLARFAKQCGIKVLFYVSPQVWAWRPGRVKKYGQVIDMMAVIFPFETDFYHAEEIPVRYVGHPSVDKVIPQRSKQDDLLLFELAGDRPVVGILPGSRANEIKRMLPEMLQAAEKVQSEIAGVQFILPQADSVKDELLAEYLQTSTLDIQVVKHQPYDVIQCCDVVMTTSGTATLEISLLTVPMVICYRLSALTYWLGRLLVNTKYIGLPNIVSGKAVVKELIQHDASGEMISTELVKILQDRQYNQQIHQDLEKVKQQLGDGGGSANMAALALEMLGFA